MKRPELYKRTVDILVQAYFDDTLEAGDCCACAIGNLVAANSGYELRRLEGDWRHLYEWHDKQGNVVHNVWNTVHCCSVGVNMKHYKGEAKRQIDSTGYTPDETCRIEYAFELAYSFSENDKKFDGLMAVVDVLDIIHENNDTEVSISTKQKFNKRGIPTDGSEGEERYLAKLKTTA